MLDHVLNDLLKVEKAGNDIEVLRRSLAPIKTIAKDAEIVARAVQEGGASAQLFSFAQSKVKKEGGKRIKYKRATILL